MGHSTWQLMKYAIEQRNYVALLGLFLQQRWLRRTCAQTTRVSGYLIVTLGISIVVFITVEVACDVVPAFAEPHDAFYGFLMFLVVTISYNILHNYVCATVFSLRLGCGPETDDPIADRSSQRGASRHTTRDHGSDSTPSSASDNDDDDDDDGVATRHGEPATDDVTPGCTTRVAERRVFAEGDDEEGVELDVRHPNSSRSTREGEAPHNEEDFSIVTRLNGAAAATAPGAAAPAAAPTLSRRGGATSGLPSRSASSSSPESLTSYGEAGDVIAEPSRSGGRVWFNGPSEDLEETISKGRQTLVRWSRVFFRFAKKAALRVRKAIHTVPKHDLIVPEVLEEVEAVTRAMELYSATERRFKLLDRARRFCRHCRRVKAPREHHCSVCNRCVARLHHHCPFLASCVDAENQRYFTLMILWLWVGTLCVNVFLGWAYAWQWRFERGLRRATTLAERVELVSPYGVRGAKLTSFPATLTLCLTSVMFVAMCLFLWSTLREVLENTTPIEEAVADEKQERVFRGTNFVFRSPYNLGAWRNFLECFRTLNDPMVHADLDRGEDNNDNAEAALLSAANDGNAGDTAHAATAHVVRSGDNAALRGSVNRNNKRFSASLASLLPPPRSFKERRARDGAWLTWVVFWLVALPTLRPSGNDGIHYPLYDTETKDLDGYCIGAACGGGGAGRSQTEVRVATPAAEQRAPREGLGSESETTVSASCKAAA